MKLKLFKYMGMGLVGCAALAGASSCTGDLNVEPNNPTTKTELTTKAEYLGLLANLYNGLLSDGIVSVSDGGAGTFTRSHFNMQEIVADECIISMKWNDPGYIDLNYNTWGNNNEWVYAALAREMLQIKFGAEFLKEIDNAPADFFTDAEKTAMKAEAHFIRGLGYYYMIDLFGRGPWIDETSVTGATPPTYNRTELFDAVTAELEQYVEQLKPASQQSYGRLSREAGYMLLAKLYLNAGVYTGTPQWQKCADYCKKIVASGLELAPTYKYLFCADNDKLVACSSNPKGELIWVVPQEVGFSETWGGTTYLTVGCWVEGADPAILTRLNNYGVPWSGLRMRPEVADALEGDTRDLLYKGEFQKELTDLSSADATSCGYMCIKYSNSPSTDYDNLAGATNNNTQVSSVDYPLFRLADVYLMLAECQLRGVSCDGKLYFDKVRERAGMEPLMLTADNLLAERQRELYMEGHRRSDLIRFGKYTGGNYKWSWKGGVFEGASIGDYRALFAIPSQYTSTLGQNPGY